MIFDAYFTSHNWKLPPSANPKVGGEKLIDGPTVHEMNWEWSPNSQVDKVTQRWGKKSCILVPTDINGLILVQF